MQSKLPKRVRNHVNPLADQTVIDFDGFLDDKPIIVDIGAYRGEFSQQLHKHHYKTHNLIVTEIRKPYANYLRDLFHGKSGVAVFDGDSAKNISGLLKKSINKSVLIDYIFVNFPDPWFKEKHKKRRVVNQDFLNQLHNLLQDVGSADQTKVIFQTDQEPLFNETVDLINQDGRWDIKFFSEPLWGMQSYWECMKISEGDKINRMQITLVKNNT